MNLLLNILWLILGGLVLSLSWFVAGIIMAISIIGLPWAKACFVMGKFTLLPFGYEAVNRSQHYGKSDIGTGALGFIGNVIWFLLTGVWLATGHLGSALACFITIIGIPFGVQHIKLAMIALAPIGKTIVPKTR